MGVLNGNTFTIAHPPHALLGRLFCLVVGLLFVAVGLFGLGNTAVALLWTGAEGNFLLGFGIGAAFTGLGALAVWCFCMPAETLVFDGDAQRAELTLRYPFGYRRRFAFPFRDMAAPEVAWFEDTDMSAGGYWALKVTLPNGRVIKQLHLRKDGQGKSKPQAWCDDILHVMGRAGQG